MPDSKEELRSQIIRATNWRELFSSAEQEWTDFRENIVGEAKARHEGYKALKQYRVEPLPEGDLHIFEDKNGAHETIQKLKSSGNVVIILKRPDGSSDLRMVTPAVGNIAHDFTVADIFLPSREFLERLGNEGSLSVKEIDLLNTYIEGKPATTEWEDLMLDRGNLPQRIGHRLYPSFVLEAQRRLKKVYLQEFTP